MDEDADDDVAPIAGFATCDSYLLVVGYDSRLEDSVWSLKSVAQGM
jgi:hypothetical protein